MSDLSSRDQLFIGKLTEIVNTHLSDENFGAEKLAEEAGMSRTKLHRRLKSIKNIDISQFIREIRLNKAMEMLKYEDVTASEVAFRVGFNSPTYFNKCFHEFFGFPPGKVKTGEQEFPETTSTTSPGLKQKVDKQQMNSRWISSPVIWGMLIIAVGAVIFIISAPLKTIRRDRLEKLKSSGEKISVAVMPFQNMTNDTIWNVWQSGIKDILISYLSNFPEELTVRSSEVIDELLHEKSIKNYSSLTPSLTRAISSQLDAEIIITGSINKSGPVIRVNAQLINPETSNTYRSFQIQAMNEKEVFAKIDSLSVLTKNYLIITLLGKELSREFQNPNNTLSPEAYRYYIYGNISFYNRDFPTACNMLLKAIREDSTFVDAMSLLSWAYINQRLYEDAKKWCLIHRVKLQEMSLNPDPDPLYSQLFEEPKATISIYKLLLINDKQNPRNYHMIGTMYVDLKQYDKAIPDLEKQLEIYKDWGLKPRWVTCYYQLGLAYHKMGMYGKEEKLYKKAEKDFPDEPFLLSNQSILALSEGKKKAANGYIEKYVTIQKENSATEAEIAADLGNIYFEAEILDKAEEYYRKALSLENESNERINNLGWFLIDKDRNLSEGMELVERALKSQPDNYNYLHTNGWGLFKQGKYKEALEMLQRSWNLRREHAVYDHESFLHLEAAKKAVAGQKN